jgi:hypothetical protein
LITDEQCPHGERPEQLEPGRIHDDRPAGQDGPPSGSPPSPLGGHDSATSPPSATVALDTSAGPLQALPPTDVRCSTSRRPRSVCPWRKDRSLVP